MTLVSLRCGTEHARFSPTRQAWRVPSAKRRELFSESHEAGRRGGGVGGVDRVAG